MNKDEKILSNLNINEKCKVKKLLLNGNIRRRLLDLGLIEDTDIEVLEKSPFGDPIAYLIRGTVIALRKDITSKIIIEMV